MSAQEPSPQRLVFGPFEIDLAAQRLLRGQQAVALRPRYFDVLVFLARNSGKLVTKDELLDAVWGHRHVSDSVLKVAINALRVALGEDAKAPRHLETVSRRGYRLMGVVPDDQAGRAIQGANAEPARPDPASAAPAPAGNLPAPQAGLIGRESDLAQLHAQLASQRLITLHGPAGVGKTRLALTAAHHAAPIDGVWLLRLDALADAEPLLATVARTLNLGASTHASAETLARALAPLQLRLVLDNAEHIIQAVAELTATLLQHAPHLQLLVTSQLPLRISGETVLAVAPLGVPVNGGDDLGNSNAAAVQLLRQRAQQHDAALPWTPQAAAHAGAIARALDGLPLALELAAARVPLLGWAGVQARLDERFALLTRGERSAPQRHQTLRAALAWSCGLLEPAEWRLLQRLSVIAGSFDLNTAAAVADSPLDAALMDALDGLREHALLSAAEPGAEPRWRLYDSVRSYAAEALRASGQETQAWSGLVDHLSALFAQADIRLRDTFLRQWLAPLKLEEDNLRAALRTALQTPVLQQQGVALFSASANYRVRAGHKRELQQDHALVAALPHEHWPPRLQADFDLAQGHLSAMGQVLAANLGLESTRRAQQVYRELGDLNGLILALDRELGCMQRLQAPLEQRMDAVARLRALEPEDWGPQQRRFRAWHEVMLLREMNNDSQFEERIGSFLATARAMGDDYGAWNSAQLLGQLKGRQGNLSSAVQLFGQAVTEMRAAGQLQQNKHVLAQWAFLRIVQDAEPGTVQLLREAVVAMQAEAMLWWMADALAWLPAHQGRWQDAMRIQAWADSLVTQRGDKRGPMFAALRERWQLWLQSQGQAPAMQAASDGSALDEATAVALAFAPVATALTA